MDDDWGFPYFRKPPYIHILHYISPMDPKYVRYDLGHLGA